MPRKSSLKQNLPAEVMDGLNRLLMEDRLTLDELTTWIKERGHDISRSAVHRYGKEFKQVREELKRNREITAALVQDMGDAARQGEQGRALVEMLSSLIYKLQAQMIGGAEEFSSLDASRLAKSLKEVAVALTTNSDFEDAIRVRVKKEMAERASKAVVAQGKKHGLSDEAIASINAQLGAA